MKKLITIWNKIEEFYYAHKTILNYVFRVVVLFVSLLLLKNHTGYNTLLTNIWVIVAISVLGAFAPYKYFLLIILAYAAVQMYSISLAVGIVVTIIFVVMYLLFFRYSPNYAMVMIMTPILFIIKLELLVPLMLAIVAPAVSGITILFGTIFFYIIKFVDINATTLTSTVGMDELAKGQMLIEGVFSGHEFLYMTIIMIAVFLIVHYIKKISVNYSMEIAIASGTGMFIILTIVAELLFGELTTSKLLGYTLGAIGSGIIAYVLNVIKTPLDYTRTELVEFEDEEYQYYVRAVPKASFEKEIVNVKKINKRKKS